MCGMGRTRVGAILAFAGAALALTGFLLHTIGWGSFSDQTGIELDAGIGFFFAIAAVALLVGAGIVGLLARTTVTTVPSPAPTGPANRTFAPAAPAGTRPAAPRPATPPANRPAAPRPPQKK
jgi:formate hydrogenlyase subunit 3/multisubunit Na+/H+ antiporter MnhD subunit